MSINLQALRTWTYSNGTLTHVASGQSVEIDISANPKLHLALSAGPWLNLGDPAVYPDDPALWLERKIDWSRRTETPPVIGVERHIGDADYEYFSVYLLEDSPDFSEVAATLRDTVNVVRSRQWTKADAREFVEALILVLQKLNLVSS